jgi:hypothetical protein
MINGVRKRYWSGFQHVTEGVQVWSRLFWTHRRKLTKVYHHNFLRMKFQAEVSYPHKAEWILPTSTWLFQLVNDYLTMASVQIHNDLWKSSLALDYAHWTCPEPLSINRTTSTLFSYRRLVLHLKSWWATAEMIYVQLLTMKFIFISSVSSALAHNSIVIFWSLFNFMTLTFLVCLHFFGCGCPLDPDIWLDFAVQLL